MAGSPAGASSVAAPLASSDARPNQPRAPEQAAESPDKLVEHRYEPPGHSASDRRPLLVFLHGLGGSGEDGLQGGLSALGARERIFVSAPDGSLDSAGRRFWNAGPACCDFDRRGVDDVRRIAELIQRWRANPSVDPKRIYVVGFSNGGFLANRLVCSGNENIAAIVNIAGGGVPDAEPCVVRPPLGVLHIHGDADPIVRYGGGAVFNRPELGRFPGARESLDSWGKRLGCKGSASALDAMDLAPNIQGAETLAATYTGCPRGDAALWTVRGGGHVVATNAAAFDAAWKWLARHSR